MVARRQHQSLGADWRWRVEPANRHGVPRPKRAMIDDAVRQSCPRIRVSGDKRYAMRRRRRPGALPGELWWRDDPDGDFYILYDDGSSIQWVSTTKPGLAVARAQRRWSALAQTRPQAHSLARFGGVMILTAISYILYNDGARAQWVPASKPGSGGGAPPFDDSHLLRLTGGTDHRRASGHWPDHRSVQRRDARLGRDDHQRIALTRGMAGGGERA